MKRFGAAVAAGAVSAALVLGSGGVVSASTPPPSDPSLQTQNEAHDHALGSTIDQAPDAAADATTKTIAGPVGTHVLGMDVSGYQPNVDWSDAWANGARFVYIKATESGNSLNSSYATQLAGASGAGFVHGAYHFANPHESSGAVQAAWFVAHGGTWSNNGNVLPPMLDIEYDPYSQADGTNSCYGLSPAQLVSWIAAFSNTVKKATGIAPTIYTTTDWWQTCTGDFTGFGANPLFIARWVGDISSGAGVLPASWDTYKLWQYNSSGVFPGDQDLFNGDFAALHLFASNGRTSTGTGTTLDEKYLDALYTDYVGRRPGSSEVTYWEAKLAVGASRSDIAGSFVNSTEYRGQRIDAAYRNILGRTVDAPGRQHWLDQMASGAITTDDIETSLYASQEYYLQHGNTDTGFVAALYQALLHRTGSASEYAFWANLTAQNGRLWVVNQFWRSTETITERVRGMYTFYLGRTPDQAGLDHWVGIALQLGDSGLRAGFTSSAEYFSRAQGRF